MQTITINAFKSQYDNIVKPHDVKWVDLVELLKQGHNEFDQKGDAVFFNAVEYKLSDKENVLRRKINIKSFQAIVLDYDGNSTIGAIKKKLKPYEYIGYTSYNHRKENKDKFRIILPVTKPIPYRCEKNKHNMQVESGEWVEIVPALKVFFSGCDPVSFRAGQLFAFPAVHPDQKHKAKVWHNKGKLFDWESLDKIENRTPDIKNGNHTSPQALSNNNLLTADTILQTKTGSIVLGEVTERVSGVQCPLHDDTIPSEFVNISSKGNIFLHCKTCGTVYMQHHVENMTIKDLPNPNELAHERKEFLKIFVEYERKDTLLQPEWFSKPDRKKIARKIETITDDIIKGDKAPWGRMPMKHIVYMPEGAGKSMLAILVAMNVDTSRVLFACKSWQQAKKKAEEFRLLADKEGLIVELALSIEGHVKNRFGINTIRKPATGPFAPGQIDAEKTIQAIIERHPQINPKLFRLFYQLIQPGYQRPYVASDKLDLNLGFPILPSRAIVKKHDLTVDQIASRAILYEDSSTRPVNPIVDPVLDLNGNCYKEFTNNVYQRKYPSFDWDHDAWKLEEPKNRYKTANIVVTTFAQAMLLPQLQKLPTSNWIIFFDDPDLSDVLSLVPYKKEEWPNMLEATVEKNTKEINGKRYFERGIEHYLGMTFRKCSVVFTTTEHLTRQAIEYQFDKFRKPSVAYVAGKPTPRKIHDEMEMLIGGNIYILGTTFVRSKIDGIIPPIVERLKKMGHRVELIADGMGSNINHSTSKGNNNLQQTHLIVELSIPHPDQVKTVCESLEIDFHTHSRDVTTKLMLDKLNQAIGRNSGYRFSGADCVVLTDPQYHKELIQKVRYKVDDANSVLIDRTINMSRLDRRTPDEASSLIKDLQDLLFDNMKYVGDCRKFPHDVKNYLNRIADPVKHEKAVQRICTSLLFQSTGEHSQVTAIEKQRYQPYRRGVIVTLKQLPHKRRKIVLEKVRRALRLRVSFLR